AAKLVVRVAALSPPMAPSLAGAREKFRAPASTLGLEHPRVLAQAIAMVGAVALALVAWRFRDLIMAFTGSISTSPAVRFLPLRSDDLSDARWYRISLDALMLVFGVSLYQLTQLRARRGIRSGAGGLILVATVLVLTTLMNVVPYRILWLNRFERADYGGVRCYIIGERTENLGAL